MKKFRISLLVALPLLLVSCNKEKIYFEKSFTFDNAIWPRFEHLNFVMPVKPGIKYNLIAEIRYDPGISFDVLPLHVIISTDDGEERIKEFQMRLKHASDYNGEIQNDGSIIYSHALRQNFSVNAITNYNVDIECFYPKYEIPYIQSVTLKLIKAKK